MIKHNYKLSPHSLKVERQHLLNAIGVLSPYASQWFPEGKKNPKGTLVWEFDKLLGEIGLTPHTWLYANHVIADLLPPVKRLLDSF